MWVIIKFKKNETEILKKSLKLILGENPEFYLPKVKFTKIVKGKIKEYRKDLLDKYILCQHSKFADSKFIQAMNYAKGLQFLLDGYKENQTNITNFINNCKSHENDDGFLKQSFFNNLIKDKIQFHSGPFSRLIFDVIEDRKKEIEILKDKIKLKISKEQKNLLFNYV